MSVLHLPTRLGGLDHETRNGIAIARRSGRSWWAVRMRHLDGWVHEWDPDPGSPNGHADWMRIPKIGRQEVRLYCPNGVSAHLGDTEDATGKLFQLKSGQRRVALSLGGNGLLHVTGEAKQTDAHIIGMISGTNGECVIYAWEPLPPPAIPLDAPQAPNEQEWIAKSAEPGLYEQAVIRWQRDFEAYALTSQYRAWAKRFQAWEDNARGRLIGPLEENVYHMKYQLVGKVNADYMGIDDGEGR